MTGTLAVRDGNTYAVTAIATNRLQRSYDGKHTIVAKVIAIHRTQDCK